MFFKLSKKGYSFFGTEFFSFSSMRSNCINHLNIIMVVVAGNKHIPRIAIKKTNKTFSVPRNRLDVHFDIIAKSFLSTQCLCHSPFTITMQKGRLETFGIKQTEFFYSCMFDLQYNTVSDICISF